MKKSLIGLLVIYLCGFISCYLDLKQCIVENHRRHNKQPVWSIEDRRGALFYSCSSWFGLGLIEWFKSSQYDATTTAKW